MSPETGAKHLGLMSEPDDGEWPFRPISEEVDSDGNTKIKTFSSSKKKDKQRVKKKYTTERDFLLDMRFALEEIAGEKFNCFEIVRQKWAPDNQGQRTYNVKYRIYKPAPLQGDQGSFAFNYNSNTSTSNLLLPGRRSAQGVPNFYEIAADKGHSSFLSSYVNEVRQPEERFMHAKIYRPKERIPDILGIQLNKTEDDPFDDEEETTLIID